MQKDLKSFIIIAFIMFMHTYLFCNNLNKLLHAINIITCLSDQIDKTPALERQAEKFRIMFEMTFFAINSLRFKDAY